MKKRLFLIILICTLFLHIPTVKALKCKYETNFFNEYSAPYKFVLETEEDENKLSKGSVSAPRFKVVFEEELEVKDGTCPSISIYQERVSGNFKIFKDNETCKNDNNSFIDLTDDDLCSEDLEGTKESSNTSSSSITGGNVQFVLTSSSEEKCQYQINDQKATSDKEEVTIKKKKNNKASGSCSVSLYTCQLVIEDDDVFYEEDTFTCPQYIYIDRKSESHANLEKFIFTVKDTGGSSDNDRKEGQSASDGKWNPNDLCADGGCNIDITEFCTDPYVSRTLKFLGLLLQIAKILVPAIIIVLGFVDLGKIIMAGKMDEVKKQAKNIFTRIAIGAGIFLLPTILITIFNVATNIVDGSTSENTSGDLYVPEDFKNCVNCILKPDDCLIMEKE